MDFKNEQMPILEEMARLMLVAFLTLRAVGTNGIMSLAHLAYLPLVHRPETLFRGQKASG
jgi:hypothetical protein